MGPRLGKFVNRRPRAIPGHNIPYVVVGTIILLFGWFGLVGGSALAGADLQIGSILVNTTLGAFGRAWVPCSISWRPSNVPIPP